MFIVNMEKRIIRICNFSIISIIILLMFVSFVSAATEIKVKTLPNHKVSIFVLDADQTFLSLDSFHKESDSSGLASAAYTGQKNKIDVLVKVSKDGKKVLSERFEDYKTGEPIFIRMDNEEINGKYVEKKVIVENGTEVENDTKKDGEETTAVEEPTPSEESSTEEEPVVNQPATGGVIANDNSDGFFSWTFYLIVGGFLIAILVVLLIWKFSTHSSWMPIPMHPQITGPQGALKKSQDKGDVVGSSSRDVLKLEKKLEEAQREIRILKNKEKIRDAERRLEDDRQELEKLRKGEN